MSHPQRGGSYVVNQDGEAERIEGTEPAPLPHRKKPASSTDARPDERNRKTRVKE